MVGLKCQSFKVVPIKNTIFALAVGPHKIKIKLRAKNKKYLIKKYF